MVAASSQSPSQIPVEAHSHCGSVFRSAVAETQGRRPSYEDAYAITSEEKTVYFWVFDGHRGDCASHFAAEVFGSPEFSPSEDKLPSNRRICRAFETVDNRLRDHLSQTEAGNSGSTAVGALVVRQDDGTFSAKLVNCGDSRCVVINAPEVQENDSKIEVKLPESLESICEASDMDWSDEASWLPEWPAVVETIDHKPNLWFERARIQGAGGKVCGGRTARLDGNLAVSRSLGDFDFKKDKRPPSEQKVSCLPDIYEVTGLPEGTLLLLACDGLWDTISTEKAAKFVRERLQKNPSMELADIAQELIDASLAETRDNVTVLLAQLGQVQDESEAEAE